MNKRQLFLILRQCTLAAVLLAVSACSFKKDPEKPAPEVVVLQEQDKLIAQPLAVISSMSEDAFIEKIKEQPMSYLEAIKSTNDESLLDLAIGLKKTKVIEFLLSKDYNPFLYNEKSADELRLNGNLKDLIGSFERPLLLKLTSQIPDLMKKGSLDSELRSKNFQIHGCIDLIATILDMEYYKTYKSDPDAGDYIPDVSPLSDPQSAIKGVMQSPVCSSLRGNISTETLQRWAENELASDFMSDFSSSTMLSLIFDLGSVENLSIEIYENGMKLRVDPQALISCSTKLSQTDRDKWNSLVEKHRATDIFYYQLTLSSMRPCKRINAVLKHEIFYYNTGSEDDTGGDE
ncbi:MAG TPA: hypothetical protein VF412_12375 [Bdellovibrio sp.]|uniref:hypothetical protein n=1 Tax=Bdellovibrio sp. TaxID=28201 RepID=UPI002F0F37B4